ncbi:hypothetical protein AB9K26_04505 [Psychroserpens sp. XS_ASV72]|uniref:hypothetical protein n=1 Tax=Psychroserpens sp. XS_ASV72 TaxID=3241293 RepID=UPI003513A737
MIRVFKHIVPKGYRGITIFPFIFLKQSVSKKDLVLINHEKIHLQQQIELLILPFYIWYVLEFLYFYLKSFNWNKAYQQISFEREAYSNEKDLNYLKSRSLWSFLKYVKP